MQALNKTDDALTSAAMVDCKSKEKATTATKKTILNANANKDIKLDYLLSEAWIDREPKYMRIQSSVLNKS